MNDSNICVAALLLQQALNDGSEYDIPCKYINNFYENVVNSMWRSIFNAIASYELYGDAQGFEFNLGGYIDTYYENDNIRWCGFSDEQAHRLKRAYPDIVNSFKIGGISIIEYYLHRMEVSDIAQAVEYFNIPSGQRPAMKFRNMKYIAYECRDKIRTAEEIYDNFLSQARDLMHYNERVEKL